MTAKYPIMHFSHSLPGRKPQRNRTIAKKAADDIRAFRFSCIYKAADAYFSELSGGEGEKDRRKDFARYIYEDLKDGPKSLHVFQAMSRYSIKRNEQPIVKAKRYAKIVSHLKQQ